MKHLFTTCLFILSAAKVYAALPTYESVIQTDARVLYSLGGDSHSDAEIDLAMQTTGFYDTWTLPSYQEQDVLDLQWQSSPWPVAFGLPSKIFPTQLPAPTPGRNRAMFIRQTITIPEGPDQVVLSALQVGSTTQVGSTFRLRAGVVYLNGEEVFRRGCCQNANGVEVETPGFLDVASLTSTFERNSVFATLSPGTHTVAVSSHPDSPTADFQYANVDLFTPINTRHWSGINGEDWTDEENWMYGNPAANEVVVFPFRSGSVFVDTQATVSGLQFERYQHPVVGDGSITLLGNVGSAADVVSANSALEFGVNLTLGSESNFITHGTTVIHSDLRFNGNLLHKSGDGDLVLDYQAVDTGRILVSDGELSNLGAFQGHITLADDGVLANFGEISGSIETRNGTSVVNDGTLLGTLTSVGTAIRGGGHISEDVVIQLGSVFSGSMSVGGNVLVDDGFIDPGDITVGNFNKHDSGIVSVAGDVIGSIEFDLFNVDKFDAVQGSGGEAHINSLVVDVSDAFLPPGGAEFAILPGWSFIEIENLELPDVTPATWDTSRLVSEGVLAINNEIGEPSPFGCDFDQNEFCDLSDLDALTIEITNRRHDPLYDMTGDGVVNKEDVDDWLTVAATRNGFSGAYNYGDADLDGKVNAVDLMQIGVNWQSTDSYGWSKADFTFDGTINAADLNLVGINWQSSVERNANQVPEPMGMLLTLVAAAFAIRCVRHCRMQTLAVWAICLLSTVYLE